MESDGSLQCSQQPVTIPYPEPDESTSHLPPYLPKIHSNIIFPSTPRPSEWSSSLQVFLESLNLERNFV